MTHHPGPLSVLSIGMATIVGGAVGWGMLLLQQFAPSTVPPIWENPHDVQLMFGVAIAAGSVFAICYCLCYCLPLPLPASAVASLPHAFYYCPLLLSSITVLMSRFLSLPLDNNCRNLTTTVQAVQSHVSAVQLKRAKCKACAFVFCWDCSEGFHPKLTCVQAQDKSLMCAMPVCLALSVCLVAVLHCLVSFPVSTCDVFSLCTARHTLPGTHCQTHGDCTVYLSASSLCMCVPQVSWATGAQDTGKCPSCRAIIHRSSGCKRAPSTALQQL